MSEDGGLPQRRRELVLGAAAAGMLVAAQVASKATRDALFLTAFDPRRLPIVMAAGAVLSLLAVVGMGRAMALRGPARSVPFALFVNATLFALEWIALPLARDVIAVALYLHVAALGSVLLSGFWTLISERFDPHRARKYVARITAGGALGGVIGGVSAELVAGRLGARAMLIVLAGASLVASLVVAQIGRAPDGAPREQEELPEEPRIEVPAVRIAARSPYLRSLAAMSMMVAAWSALLDFALKAGADRAFTDERSLVAFFAAFYTISSLVTVLVQSAFGALVLRKLGIAYTLALLPILVAVGGLGLLFGAPFAGIVALRGGESVMSNSLFRAAYELFFTPLPRETKRPTKALVDVAATRVGDALGALLVLALIYGWRGMPAVVPAVVAAAVALFALLVIPRVAAGYVEALRAALRSGVVELEPHAGLDATTSRAVSDTRLALDRERLLAEVEELRRAAGSHPEDGAAAAAAAAAAIVVSHPDPEVEAEVAYAAPHPTEPGLVHRFAAIASGATGRVRAALRDPLPPELVPIVVHHLAHPELGRDALVALRRVAAASTGTLVDALLDRRTPFEVRFRIPRVLRASITRRAAHGLAEGLGDPRLEVRFQCARALVHLASADATLAPAPDRVLDCVESELAERGATWSAVAAAHAHELADPHANGNGAHDHHRTHGHHHDDDPISLDELVRLRASRSLQYVLTLLSLVVDGEALQLALRGLSASEERIRGTAIELLEHVLPDSVRGTLLSVLASREPSEVRARSREEIVAELLASQERLPLVKPRADAL